MHSFGIVWTIAEAMVDICVTLQGSLFGKYILSYRAVAFSSFWIMTEAVVENYVLPQEILPLCISKASFSFFIAFHHGNSASQPTNW
jgi:hypothetical protein